MTEMSSYPVTSSKVTTLWDLFEKAAKAQYGNSIKVIKTKWATQKLDNMEFTMTIETFDKEPKEASRTIVDINMKEYTNRCEKEVDETLVRLKRSSSRSTEDGYQFSSTKGVNWGIGGNIGAQVMGAMAGGNVGISANYGRQKSETHQTSQTMGSDFTSSYEQEEKIRVPPMSRVIAKITTYSMKYERGYTLRLSIPSTVRFPVVYKTRCQQSFCGAKSGHITAARLLQSLPDYREKEAKVSFIQTGTLSWMGEGSSIDKTVEPVEATYIQ